MYTVKLNVLKTYKLKRNKVLTMYTVKLNVLKTHKLKLYKVLTMYTVKLNNMLTVHKLKLNSEQLYAFVKFYNELNCFDDLSG